MREVRISDITMKRAFESNQLALSFKEKLELAKLLDGLGVSVIEIEGITSRKADMLRIKSIASLVGDCVLAVPVALDASDVDDVWAALSAARHPRLQVQAATSPARMEYVHKKKADGMLQAIDTAVRACAAVCPDVEFIADDATRTDVTYLRQAIAAAVAAGATTVTVADDAGNLLPGEFAQFVADLIAHTPELKDVALGISCTNDLYMSVSSSIAGITEGATEVKATAYLPDVVSLRKIATVLADKGDAIGVTSPVRTHAIKRTMAQIERICDTSLATSSLFANVGSETAEGISLTLHDNAETVAECVAQLGYDLSDDDLALVYEAFLRTAAKKDDVDGRELDAIVAAVALQVPATYTVERYTINSGNTIKATAFVELVKHSANAPDEHLERVGLGDGPLDAAFDAIEQITGRHFELDDWQMQAVTEGQEAMGEAIVKLLANGKVYSGRGISTNITGSSIRAYVNALNKIVYEEGNE